jgi:hypothetical protein
MRMYIPADIPAPIPWDLTLILTYKADYKNNWYHSVERDVIHVVKISNTVPRIRRDRKYPASNNLPTMADPSNNQNA